MHSLADSLRRVRAALVPVLPLVREDVIAPLDCTLFDPLSSTLEQFVATQVPSHCKYAIGGFGEDRRNVYKHSQLFADSQEEPRTIHLGVDIWARDGDPVYAPLAGCIHSVGINDHVGDYGGTIITEHRLDGHTFYLLYGHLSHDSARQFTKGESVVTGQRLGALGSPVENGQWPPHLHFQVILDMMGKEGDYPGVCKASERDAWMDRVVDPQFVLPQFYECMMPANLQRQN